jgi:hypothetical protein
MHTRLLTARQMGYLTQLICILTYLLDVDLLNSQAAIDKVVCRIKCALHVENMDLIDHQAREESMNGQDEIGSKAPVGGEQMCFLQIIN